MNVAKMGFLLIVVLAAFQLCNFQESCEVLKTDKDTYFFDRNSNVTMNISVSNTCHSFKGNLTDFTICAYTELACQLFCSVIIKNGSCTESLRSQDCACDSQTNQIIVSRYVQSSRCPSWRLTARFNNSQTSSKNVSIKSPFPEITNLTATTNSTPVNETSPVTRNTTVTVTCVWHEGYPPQTARLTKDGVKLNSDYDMPRNDTRCLSLRQIDYVIQNAQCSDSGLITCEAAGSAHNKSLTLLVRCEPQFRNNHSHEFVINSTDLTLRFPVLTHETKITECWLKKPDNGQITFTTQASVIPQDVNCTGSAFLHGTAPDLTLTIQLSNVTSAMEGAWQLLLGNSEGNGSVHLSIKRAAAAVPADESVLVPLLVTSIVAVAIVFISLVIICCLKKKMKKKRKRGRKARKSSRQNGQGCRDRRTPAVPSAFYRGSNVSLMITNDIYEGSGSMRTDDPFGYSEVRDRLRESPPGGAATDVGRTAGASPPCEADGYTEIGDVCVSQPRPQRQSVQVVHIRKTETGACGVTETYADVAEIRKRKEEQRKQKEKRQQTSQE